MTEPSLFDFYLGGSSPNGATAPTSSANTTQGHVNGGVINRPSPSKDLNDPIVTSALDGDEDLLASHRADRIPIEVDPRSGSSCWSHDVTNPRKEPQQDGLLTNKAAIKKIGQESPGHSRPNLAYETPKRTAAFGVSSSTPPPSDQRRSSPPTQHGDTTIRYPDSSKKARLKDEVATRPLFTNYTYTNTDPCGRVREHQFFLTPKERRNMAKTCLRLLVTPWGESYGNEGVDWIRTLWSPELQEKVREEKVQRATRRRPPRWTRQSSISCPKTRQSSTSCPEAARPRT